MQQIVHQMGASKAYTVLRRGFFLKGEMSREEIVHDKAEHIADGIGYVHIDPVLQHPIDNVVQGCCHYTHNTESYRFSENLFLLHISWLFSCLSNAEVLTIVIVDDPTGFATIEVN